MRRSWRHWAGCHMHWHRCSAGAAAAPALAPSTLFLRRSTLPQLAVQLDKSVELDAEWWSYLLSALVRRGPNQQPRLPAVRASPCGGVSAIQVAWAAGT